MFGKLYNARWSIERTRRDHGLRVDAERLTAVSAQLKALLPQVVAKTSLDSLRGLEGAGATACFGVFDELVLEENPLFVFQGRSRRPPLDPINALLSLDRTLLPELSPIKDPDGKVCFSNLPSGLSASKGGFHMKKSCTYFYLLFSHF